MTNLWQECRAYIATVLFCWAQAAHFGATMDLARKMTALDARARLGDPEAAEAMRIDIRKAIRQRP